MLHTLTSFSRCRAQDFCSLISKRHTTTTYSTKSSLPLDTTPASEPAVSESIPVSKSATSSTRDTLEASLRRDLTNRPVGITKSILDPTPSHLLNLLLAELLPQSCHAPPVTFFSPRKESKHVPGSISHEVLLESLPQGYHLAYFPPAVPSSQLLADGTDNLHSPGPPFFRRLWAGGSVVFHPRKNFELVRMKSSVCEESIKDVKVKGIEGDEKVFVQIQRSLGGTHKRFNERHGWVGKGTKTSPNDEGVDGGSHSVGIGNWSLSETRDLVFMREKPREQALKDVETKGRILKPQLIPDWSVTLKPTPDVLFRWSALTYNAHRIHLDPQYCREVEGHRNMLVHGPLSLILMLSSLRSQLKPGEMILQLNYRNLTPLYVNEEMKICIKHRQEKANGEKVAGDVQKAQATGTPRNPKNQRVYDIWVEGNEGGYAVKGTAIIGKEISGNVASERTDEEKAAKRVKKETRKLAWAMMKQTDTRTGDSVNVEQSFSSSEGQGTSDIERNGGSIYS